MKAGAPPPQSPVTDATVTVLSGGSLNEGGGAAPAIAANYKLRGRADR